MMTRRTMLAAGTALGVTPFSGRAWARETAGLCAREIAVRLHARHVYAVGCADDEPLLVGQPVVVEFAHATRTLHIGNRIAPAQAQVLRQIEGALAAMQASARHGITLEELAAIGREMLNLPWRHAAAMVVGRTDGWHLPLAPGTRISLEAGAYAPDSWLGGRIKQRITVA